VWLWDGERRIVHLTIAAANGGEVPEGTTLHSNLGKAITAACDPSQHFRIDSYKPRTFNLVVKIKIDSHYLPDKVIEQIKQAVTSTFAFEQRSFGQSVTISEIFALVQGVEGVVYVDIDPDQLQYADAEPEQLPQTDDTSAPSQLIAQIAHWEKGEIQPAELLTLSTLPNSLQVITL